MARQASATLPTTSAEVAVPQPTVGNNTESLASAMSTLKSQIVGQQIALNLMLDKVIALRTTSTKSKSPQVQAAISEVIGTFDVVRNVHDMVVKAFKASSRAVQEQANIYPSVGKETPLRLQEPQLHRRRRCTLGFPA